MDHITATAATASACVVCHRPLPGWDPDRLACALCQQHTDHHLRQIPELNHQLQHGTIGSGWRTGSRGAAAGSRPPSGWSAAVSDLTGPSGLVLHTLAGWCADWADVGQIAPPEWPAGSTAGQVDTACRWLRWHLDWACRRHPAVDEAMAEIAAVARHVRAAVGERAERRVGVTCGCGVVLHVTATTGRTTCAGCGTAYNRVDVLQLPLAPRAA